MLSNCSRDTRSLSCGSSTCSRAPGWCMITSFSRPNIAVPLPWGVRPTITERPSPLTLYPDCYQFNAQAPISQSVNPRNFAQRLPYETCRLSRSLNLETLPACEEGQSDDF